MTNESCYGFIASSSVVQAKLLADSIATSLRNRFINLYGVSQWDVRPWFFDADLTGGLLLDRLMTKCQEIDFAVVVLHPDDPVEKNGGSAVLTRDNVVFELGMFISALGLERVFVFRPSERSLSNFCPPTDIDGLIAFTYDLPEPGAEDAGAPKNTWLNQIEYHCATIATRLQNAKKPWHSQRSSSSSRSAAGAPEEEADRSNYVIYGVKQHMALLRNFADCHTTEFNFMGTMVGYSYVIPPQLSQFVVEQSCVSYEINIVGSQHELNIPVSEKRLFIFPYALVLKTIRNILSAYDTSKFRNKDSLHIQFNVFYYPNDIIDAICSISPKCWFQSQGLDPKQLDIYMEEYKDRYIGVRLPVEDNHIGRYMDIIKRRQKQAESAWQKWEMEIGCDESLSLDVSGCVFLEFLNNRLAPRKPPIEDRHIVLSGQEVREFAETRYQALRRLVPSIGQIDDKIREKFPQYHI